MLLSVKGQWWLFASALSLLRQCISGVIFPNFMKSRRVSRMLGGDRSGQTRSLTYRKFDFRLWNRAARCYLLRAVFVFRRDTVRMSPWVLSFFCLLFFMTVLILGIISCEEFADTHSLTFSPCDSTPCKLWHWNGIVKTKTKLNCVAWVHERTILTKRPPLVGEVSANFCG
jgi:hypothetical protein